MVEEGQTINIACSATGQPPPTITWSRAIGSLPDRITISNSGLKINNLSRKDGGIYICKAENILGTAVKTAQLMIFSQLKFKVRPSGSLKPTMPKFQSHKGWKAVTSCRLQYSSRQHTCHFQCQEITRGIVLL